VGSAAAARRPPADDEIDEIVPIERVARSLGVTVQTVINMMSRGDFPKSIPLKMRRHLFRRSDLDLFWCSRLGGRSGSRFPLVADE
jgi:predicted DNA-binding transcriptional regulator AlpA